MSRLVALLAMVVGATAAGQPVLTSWNPLYSAGDWEFSFPVTPAWLHLPVDPTGMVGPKPDAIPNDDGQYQFFVTIPNANVNLSSIKQVSALLVDADANLLIDSGRLTVFISVGNGAEIDIHATGSLQTPLFENLPLGLLEITTLGEINAVTIENRGSIVAGTGATLVAAAINNDAAGHIEIDAGGVVLSTGLVNNDGEIRLLRGGSEVLASQSSLTLTGNGRLVIDHPAASVASLATINNQGQHTIRGLGNIVAGILTNDGTIRADEAGQSLGITIGSLTNSSALFALGNATMSVHASSVSNSGLIEASGFSRIDITAGSLDNRDTNPDAPLLPTAATLHQGMGVRAIDHGIVKIEGADIDNVNGIIEAREQSIIQLQRVRLRGGWLHSDDTSILTVTDFQSYLRDFSLSGVLGVQPGGYANLEGTIDNRGSEINVAAGAHLDFEYGSAVTLVGGMLTGPGTVSKEFHNALTLDARAGLLFDDISMAVYPGGHVTLLGTLTNDATIRLLHDGQEVAPTLWQVDGAGRIDGHGRLLFGPGTTKNRLTGTTPDSVLTNDVAHTLATETPAGWGKIEIDLVNHGMVDAGHGNLVVTSASIRNDGIMQSSLGGTLWIGGDFLGNVLDNRGGAVQALAGSVTRMTNLRVEDGLLAGDGIIDIGGLTTLVSSDMHITGHLRVSSQQDLILEGSFRNDGVIESVSSPGFDSSVTMRGDVTLGGSGRLIFSNNVANYLLADASGGTLTQGADHTIATTSSAATGEIHVSLTNHGTVDANQGTLLLLNKTNANDGLMYAMDGGTLVIGLTNTTATLDNAGGILRADPGSVIVLNNLTVRGGRIEGIGSVIPASIIAPVLFDGTTGMHLDANIDIPSSLRLQGDIVNDGRVRLVESNFATALGLVGPVDLRGTGKVEFYYGGGIGSRADSIVGVGASARLIHHAGHLITTATAQSTGTIAVGFDNFGTIEANAGYLAVRAVDNINRGTLRAVNGGTLSLGDFHATAVLDNAGGTIFVDGASNVVGGLKIRGGHLDGPGWYHAQGLNAFDGASPASAIVIDANVLVGYAGTLHLTGQVIHNGLMRVSDPDLGGPAAYLVANGEAMLEGMGLVELTGPYDNAIVPATNQPGHRLIHGADHRIRASGAGTQAQIDANVTNLGSVEIDQATLVWRSTANVNRGTIRATNGAALWLGDPHATAVLDNGSGRIDIDESSVVIASGATLRGGHVTGTGSVYVQGSAGYDGASTAGAITLDANTTVGYLGRLTVKGSIINNATLSFVDPDLGGAAAVLVYEGAVELSGTGRVTFDNVYENYLAAGPSAHLTIGADQTVSARQGTNNNLIGALTLNGTLGADGGTLVLHNPIANNGLVRATQGALQQFYYATSGAGGWRADGGQLYFHSGANPITAGPITLLNGGRIDYVNNIVTSSDVSIDATSLLVVGASTQIRLTGDFVFMTQDESKWAWNSATSLHMNGVGAPLLAASSDPFVQWAALEIGGLDTGIDPHTHTGDPAGFALTNFYLPALTLGSGAHVYLTDFFDNGHRGGTHGDAEALYVDTLTFADESAVLDLNGLHLYYRTLAGSADQIINEPVPIPTAVALFALPLCCLRRRKSSNSRPA